MTGRALPVLWQVASTTQTHSGAVMHQFKVSTNSIASIASLASALNLSREQLNKALTLPVESRYVEGATKKNDGTTRTVYNPHPYIRLVQSRINRNILGNENIISWPDYIYGSIPNSHKGTDEEIQRDYIACASKHCLSKSLLKIDIKDFFDNVHSHHVRTIFRNVLHYSEEVSEILTDLCTFEGHLPQGGLTSGYLACLILNFSEHSTVKRLQRKRLTYTRYVDDITVSSKQSKYDFSYAKRIIYEMLDQKDLPTNESKCSITFDSSTPLIVHGLRVSFKEPRLPAKEVGKIRSAVRSVEKLASIPNYRTTHTYRKDFNRCLGRVNKLARVGHKQHHKLVSRLLAVRPLARRQDVRRVRSALRKLEHHHATHRRTRWYYKKYNVVSAKIVIIKRNFPNVAEILRRRLRAVPPEYHHNEFK